MMTKLKFVEVKSVKPLDSSLGIVLSDIESRMPNGHPYRDTDKITWAHETTHGINAKIRNSNLESGAIKNGLYLLNGNGLLVYEPKNLTLRQVASAVPTNLRGNIYKLYMVDQASSWNDRPLYTFDEWSAYQNGTACRNDLNIESRSETVQYMWEMAVYGSYAIMVDPNVDYRRDERIEALTYMLNRSSVLYYASKFTQSADAYLEKIKLETKLVKFWKDCGFEFLKNL